MPRSEPSPRVSVRVAAGSQITAGGGLVSASVGFRLLPRFSVLAGVERVYLPDYGGQPAETATFGTVEGRLDFRGPNDVSPYVLAMYGRGASQGDRIVLSPEYATKERFFLLLGGGLRVPVRRRLEVFADVRVGPKIGPYDIVLPHLPVRAGVAWRF
jgi:hypothetical protein